MEIIKPSCELWIQENPIDHVARCARVCYASDKTTGNEAMYKRLIDSKHLSMLRHQSVYIIAPYKDYRAERIEKFKDCPYVQYVISTGAIYIATNAQFIMENEDIKYFVEWEVDPIEFENTPVGFTLMRYTFKVVTQISTSRELNRVSPNNIAEQSTRYVNLSKKGGAICQPHWLNDKAVEVFNTTERFSIYRRKNLSFKEFAYLTTCEENFIIYNRLLKEEDILPQDARGVLPLDTATVCVYTYSIDEWRHIIDLRYYGTTGMPHPNAVIIAGMIREKLIDAGHEFR